MRSDYSVLSRTFLATAMGAALASCSSSDTPPPAAHPGLSAPKESLEYAMAACPSAIQLERKDLAQLTSSEVFGTQTGTYRLKRMRFYMAAQISREASATTKYKPIRESGSFMVEVRRNDIRKEAYESAQEICRHATSEISLTGEMEAYTWIDATDSYSNDAVELRLTRGQLRKEVVFANVDTYVRTQLADPQSRARVYRTANGGILITNSAEQIGNGTKLISHFETEYELDSQIQTDSIDSFISHFYGLKNQAHPNNPVFSGGEAVQAARSAYQKNPSLRAVKRILKWAATLKNSSYPSAPTFPGKSYATLSLALLDYPGLDFDLLVARTAYYQQLRESNYPNNPSFPDSRAFQEALGEMKVPLNVGNF